MTQRVVTLLAVITLIFLPAALCTVAAQAVATSAIVIPCEDEKGPGRATLKRRVESPAQGETAAETTSHDKNKTEKCKRENHESIAADQPVALNFEGVLSIDQDELRKYLKEKRADRTGELIGNSSYFESTSKLIKEFLVARGFRHAAVTGRLDETVLNSRTATFVVNEGLRIPIAEYRFQGNKVFSTAELTQEIKQCMTRYRGDYYDPDVFDYCKYLLADFVRSRGYLKAEFGEPRLDESAAALVITIPIKEGVIYRIGQIRIEGSSLFSPEKLRALAPFREGEIANAGKFAAWLYEDLKKLYGKNGYIQYTAELVPEFKLAKDEFEGGLDLVITIDEGQCFKVRKIKFVGERLPDNLASMMLIHNGDVYDQSLFEKSIEFLNNSNLFEFIDKDKDTDFRSNEEEGLVDISIKLTRKAQQNTG